MVSKVIGSRHIEFGAPYQCLQVPIHEDIAHVEGIPDPEPSTLFLVDHHVFSNCDRQDVFTYNDEKTDSNGNVIIGCLAETTRHRGLAAKRAGVRFPAPRYSLIIPTSLSWSYTVSGTGNLRSYSQTSDMNSHAGGTSHPGFRCSTATAGCLNATGNSGSLK